LFFTGLAAIFRLDKEQSMIEKENKSNHLQITITVLIAILILFHFFASFFPQARIWGINLLAFFPIWVRILFTLVPLLFLIPFSNKIITDLFSAIGERICPSNLDRKRFLWYLFFSLLSILIFWFFRTKTYFLGDGYQVISHIESPYIFLKWSEPLDFWIHFKLCHILNKITTVSGAMVFAWVSIISGAFFVFLSFYLAELLGEGKGERFFIFASFLTMGTIQLFFGYAEVYTLVTLTVFAYLVFSLRYLKRKGGLILPLLFFLISLPCHFSAIYLFPSLLILFLGRERKEGENYQKRKKENIVIIALFSVLAITIFSYILIKNKTFLLTFVPFFKSRYNAPGLTLFSPKHLLEFLNQYFLIVPVFFLLIPFLFVKFFKVIFRNRIALFLFLVAVSQMGFHFVIFSGLGYARDWDLFASCGLGLTILGICLFLNWAKTSPKSKYAASLIVVSSFFFTLPWILVNTSTEKSIERFKVILNYEPRLAKNGYFALAQYYEKNGFVEDYTELQTSFAHLYPETEQNSSAVGLWKEGKFENAIDLLEQAIKIDPTYADAYCNLGINLLELNRFSEAEIALKKAIELNPYNYKYRLNLGRMYAKKNEYEAAIKVLKEAEKLAPQESMVHLYLCVAYNMKGDIANSIKEGEIAVKLNPLDAEAHYDLGQIYYKGKIWEKALREFKTFISINKDTSNVEQIKKIIQELEAKGYK
jgi:tetratricopeptide (TPR) repeat protein